MTIRKTEILRLRRGRAQGVEVAAEALSPVGRTRSGVPGWTGASAVRVALAPRGAGPAWCTCPRRWCLCSCP